MIKAIVVLACATALIVGLGVFLMRIPQREPTDGSNTD